MAVQPRIGKLLKLQEIDVRGIWPKEAEDLSRWMRDNIEVLNDALGLQIEIEEAESRVGNFRLDLAGNEARTQKPVVIENQFGKTDHDHLGKLITYAAGREAGILVWIAMDFQQPHRDALHWLNGITGPEMLFYGVNLEVFRIDESSPAPKYTLVVEPPPYKRSSSVSTISPKAASYQAFWAKFLQHMKDKYPGVTRAISAQAQSWFSTGAGVSGFSLNATFTGDGRFRVELYIDTGNKEQNKAAFGQLQESDGAIQQTIGENLDWTELPDRRASRISLYRPGSSTIDDSSETLDEYVLWGSERMARFREVFRPLLTRLTLA